MIRASRNLASSCCFIDVFKRSRDAGRSAGLRLPEKAETS
jgi:hypothetical protein